MAGRTEELLLLGVTEEKELSALCTTYCISECEELLPRRSPEVVASRRVLPSSIFSKNPMIASSLQSARYLFIGEAPKSFCMVRLTIDCPHLSITSSWADVAGSELNSPLSNPWCVSRAARSNSMFCFAVALGRLALALPFGPGGSAPS